MTITAQISMTPEQMSKAWVVYLLYDHTGTAQYVGCCQLTLLAAIPDARANGLFARFFPSDKLLTVQVIDVQPDRTTARHSQWAYLRNIGRPYMQSAGRDYRGTTPKRIRCIETGEIFPSLAAAAAAHGVATSHLSNHLSCKPGYRTVKGKTYKHEVKV